MPVRVDSEFNIITDTDEYDTSRIVLGSSPYIITSCYAEISGLTEMTASKSGTQVYTRSGASADERESTMTWAGNTTNLTSLNKQYPYMLKHMGSSGTPNPTTDVTVANDFILNLLASDAIVPWDFLNKYYWYLGEVPFEFNFTNDHNYTIVKDKRNGITNACQGFDYSGPTNNDTKSWSDHLPDFLTNGVPLTLPPGVCHPYTGGYLDRAEPFREYPTPVPFYGIEETSRSRNWEHTILVYQCSAPENITYQYQSVPAVNDVCIYDHTDAGGIVYSWYENYLISQSYTNYTAELKFNTVQLD